MLDEVAPEIIWISGFGTFAVMCVMVIVWYISTREVKVKAESPQSTVEVATKTSRRKKQLGSPRNKKPNEKSREVNEHTLPSQEDTEKPENVVETNPPPTQVENIPSKEKEEVVTKSTSAEVPVKKEPERPPPPTVPVVSKKQKHKSRQNAATSSGLSDQNIGQVVTGSTLSEDKTQLIMSSLYQEEEWEATNKFDNVKSLKKLNEDLQVRCKDAEKSAQLHSNRIKELGAELKKERNRAAAAENLNQTKLGKLQEENNNLRKLIAQYQAERKLSNGHEPEHQSLHQDNSKLVNDLQSQVAAYEKELQELSGKIKQDQTENVKKIEKLKAMEREKNSIQEKYHKSNDEVHSLRGQIASNKQEIDGLNNSLKKANDLNESCKDDMDKMKLEIKHKVETIQMQEDKFNNQLEELKNQSKHELEGLQVVVSQLQEEKSNLSAALDKLQNANVAAEETQVQQPSEQASCVSIDVQCDFTEESDTSEMKATIDQLKLDNSTLQSKIDSLKTKNTTLRDNCWKALDDLEKAKKEHTEAIGRMENDYKNERIKQETDITENIQREYKAYILSLFPNLLDNNDVFDDWLEYAKDHVTNQQSTIKLSLEEKDAKISELTSELDEKLCLTDDLRNTLSETMVKLEDLMKKWEQQEVEYSSRLENEQQARASAENQLVDATEKITRLTNKVDELQALLSTIEKTHEITHQKLQDAAVELEKDVAHLQQQLNQETQLKTDAIDKAELVNGKLAEVENQLSQMTDRHDVLDKEVAQLKVELENSTKMCKDKDSLVDSLRSANKDLHFRLEQQSKFSPPPSVLGTSSEV